MPKVQRQKISKAKPTDRSKKPTATDTIEDIAGKPLLNKAEKKKQRHEAWMEKLDHSYATKKKQQKKANKQGALNKGFDDFGDVLQMIQKETPSLTTDTSSATTSATNSAPGSHIIASNKLKSKKAKKQAMMQEMMRFQKVMQHDAFKQDPLSTIRLHVQNSFNQ